MLTAVVKRQHTQSEVPLLLAMQQLLVHVHTCWSRLLHWFIVLRSDILQVRRFHGKNSHYLLRRDEVDVQQCCCHPVTQMQIRRNQQTRVLSSIRLMYLSTSLLASPSA
jgi:hypothetical protein